MTTLPSPAPHRMVTGPKVDRARLDLADLPPLHFEIAPLGERLRELVQRRDCLRLVLRREQQRHLGDDHAALGVERKPAREEVGESVRVDAEEVADVRDLVRIGVTAGLILEVEERRVETWRAEVREHAGRHVREHRLAFDELLHAFARGGEEEPHSVVLGAEQAGRILEVGRATRGAHSLPAGTRAARRGWLRRWQRASRAPRPRPAPARRGTTARPRACRPPRRSDRAPRRSPRRPSSPRPRASPAAPPTRATAASSFAWSRGLVSATRFSPSSSTSRSDEVGLVAERGQHVLLDVEALARELRRSARRAASLGPGTCRAARRPAATAPSRDRSRRRPAAGRPPGRSPRPRPRSSRT